jgi:hypothetical protein
VELVGVEMAHKTEPPPKMELSTQAVAVAGLAEMTFLVLLVELAVTNGATFTQFFHPDDRVNVDSLLHRPQRSGLNVFQ